MQYDPKFRPTFRPDAAPAPVTGGEGTLAGLAELVRAHLGCEMVVICLAAPFADLLAADGLANGAGGAGLAGSAEPIGAVARDRALPRAQAALADPARLTHPVGAVDRGFAFYAGLPLRLASGQGLGTLAALDRTPRKLLANELATLRMLAGIIVQLAELRLAVAGGGVAGEAGA